MIKNIRNKDNKLLVIYGVVFLCLFIMYLILNLFFISNHLNSDMVAEINFAVDVYNKKSLFPNGWYYANELSTFRPALICSLFYAITKNMMLSHIISLNITFILVCASYVYMVSPILKKREYILLGLILLLALFSLDFIECMFLFYGYYGFYHIFVMLISGFYMRVLLGIKSKYDIVLKIIIYISSFFLCVMGIRMLQIIYIPLLIMELIRLVIEWSKGKKIKFDTFIEVLKICLSGFLGYFYLKVYLIDNVNLAVDFSEKNLIQIGSLIPKIEDVLHSLVKLMGYQSGVPLISASGVYSIVSIFIFIFTIIVIVIIFYKKITNIELIVFLLLSFILSVIATTLVGNVLERYYFVFPIIVSICIVYFVDMLKINTKLFKLSQYLLLIVVSLSVFVKIIPLYKVDNNASRKDIVSDIINLGFEDDRVYGTFWNSYILTGLSNGLVEGASLGFYKENKITPSYWLSKDEFYSKDFRDDNTLWILDSAEKDKLLECGIVPSEDDMVAMNDDFTVYSFDYNPFINDLIIPEEPGDKVEYKGMDFYRFFMNKSNGFYEDCKLKSNGTSFGAVLYGPYMEIQEGDYSLELTYSIDNLLEVKNNSLGYFDVFSNEKGGAYAKTNIDSRSDNVRLMNVSINNTDDIEFRVLINKGVKITIESLVIEKNR